MAATERNSVIQRVAVNRWQMIAVLGGTVVVTTMTGRKSLGLELRRQAIARQDSSGLE
jgi:hypothetical protein